MPSHILQRRCFCAATTATLAVLTCAASVHAQTPSSSLATSYETIKVADGVFAFVSRESGIVSGNSMLVVGDSAAMVIDAGHFPATTRRIIAEIRTLTSKPVRFLLNTHWHPDHWTGNAEFAAAFPGLAIISTTETQQQISRIGTVYLGLYQDSAAVMKQARGPLDSGRNPDGTPLSEDQRLYSTAVTADAPSAIAGWRGARVQAPTVTFDKSLDIALGGRLVRVMFLGRGNTAGDAVAFVPDSRTLATGDLLVHPTPYAYGSFFADWIQVMTQLKSLGALAIVPGHGAVQRDTTYLSLISDLLAAVRSQVTASVRRGLSLEETRKALTLESFERRLFGDDALRRARFRLDFLAPGVARAYDEAKYELGR